MTIFDDAKQSAYALWKNLGTVINPGKTKRSIDISKLISQGQFTKGPHEIANNMQKHFCEIGKKLQQTIPQLEERYINYLQLHIENRFFLAPANSEEVSKEISNLIRKACGPDNIATKILHLCPYIFAQNLSKIYNRVIEKGEYPTQLKLAKVNALYKKGQRHVAYNYRPNSLLSCFNEVMENILAK